MKTFFFPTFDLPGEKNPDEVFNQIGRGKMRKFWNFVGRSKNPSSINFGTLWAAKKILAPF
jgi:hypothetical protein